jgi:hypothetical protein
MLLIKESDYGCASRVGLFFHVAGNKDLFYNDNLIKYIDKY